MTALAEKEPKKAVPEEAIPPKVAKLEEPIVKDLGIESQETSAEAVEEVSKKPKKIELVEKKPAQPAASQAATEAKEAPQKVDKKEAISAQAPKEVAPEIKKVPQKPALKIVKRTPFWKAWGFWIRKILEAGCWPMETKNDWKWESPWL